MTEIQKKVQELGFALPSCPAPLAAYVPATRFGETIVVSGQLPSVNGDLSDFCGQVPTGISPEKAKNAAAICFLNNLAAAMTLLEQGETLRLVQMQGFVQSEKDFHEQPAILNGASELAVKILGEYGRHTRTAVGVVALPKNASVEISCTFQVVPEKVHFNGRYNWIEKK